MASLRDLRLRVARWIAPTAPRKRLYAGSRNTRTTGGFGASASSADTELSSSLTALRSRSRQMVRDSAYAKRAKVIIVNNIIGSGVGLQAQVMNTRGELAIRVNEAIEATFADWSQGDQCHTGGTLHFSDMERAAMGEVFEAGEILIRMHRKAFGRGVIPLALELIEADRLADHADVVGVAAGNELRMGVEVDSFHRPQAYWIRKRHRGDVNAGIGNGSEQVERVPAEDIFHLRVVNRWPQTRGEPWMHAVVRKLDDLNEYSQLEVTAARASAAYFATITSPESPTGLATDDEAGKPVMDIEPLTIQELAPGEELQFHAPNRPNSALEGFMRAMLREIAAGTGASYESLSRDYSQSNYSSSRLALMDDRDSYKALQQWWIRSFRQPLHSIWMHQAMLARAIPGVTVEAFALDRARYESARWKPRGWSWIDPTKEVNAYKEAIKAGLTTLTDVIAQTADGRDIEDVIQTRRRELDMLEAADIDVDTTVEEPVEPPPLAAAPVAEPEDDEDDAEDQADDLGPASRVDSVSPPAHVRPLFTRKTR